MESIREQISSLSLVLSTTSEKHPADGLRSVSCSSSSSENLSQVALVSTNVQLLACNLCAMTFKDLENLDNHIRVNHKSLHCKTCDKTLRSQPDLNLHNHKIHADIEASVQEATTDIQCDQCSFECKTNGDLASHIATYHNSQGASDVPILPGPNIAVC